MANKSVIKILVQNGLKVTPQRIAILEVILSIDTHPDADKIAGYLRVSHPNISIGTIYNTLDTFCKKGIIRKIFTSKDSVRYDSVSDRHHHLYCTESELIVDFYDDELNNMLANYMKKKNLPNFKVESINIQITGNFTNNIHKDKSEHV